MLADDDDDDDDELFDPTPHGDPSYDDDVESFLASYEEQFGEGSGGVDGSGGAGANGNDGDEDEEIDLPSEYVEGISPEFQLL